MSLPIVRNAAANREGFYIGRLWAGLPKSDFANPFSVGEDTPENRQVAVYRFLVWFLDQPMRMRLHEPAAAPAIVCWCAPALCHGHVIRWLIEESRFNAPCPMCGDPGRSILNVHVPNPRQDRALVYESGKCAKPGCGYYRFRHVRWWTPEELAVLATQDCHDPDPQPTLL